MYSPFVPPLSQISPNALSIAAAGKKGLVIDFSSFKAFSAQPFLLPHLDKSAAVSHPIDMEKSASSLLSSEQLSPSPSFEQKSDHPAALARTSSLVLPQKQTLDQQPPSLSSLSAPSPLKPSLMALNGLPNVGNTCAMNSVLQLLSRSTLNLEAAKNDENKALINAFIELKNCLIKENEFTREQKKELVNKFIASFNEKLKEDKEDNEKINKENPSEAFKTLTDKAYFDFNAETKTGSYLKSAMIDSNEFFSKFMSFVKMDQEQLSFRVVDHAKAGDDTLMHALLPNPKVFVKKIMQSVVIDKTVTERIIKEEQEKGKAVQEEERRKIEQEEMKKPGAIKDAYQYIAIPLQSLKSYKKSTKIPQVVATRGGTYQLKSLVYGPDGHGGVPHYINYTYDTVAQKWLKFDDSVVNFYDLQRDESNLG